MGRQARFRAVSREERRIAEAMPRCARSGRGKQSTARAADPPAIQPHPRASPSQQAALPHIAATPKPERYV
jgi:hypothetical protein